MKRSIFILCLIAFCTGCKKDSDTQSVILLSEVLSDGAVSVRFSYNDAEQLIAYEGYSAGQVSIRFTIDYNTDGHISSLSSFQMPGDIPFSRALIQCDAEGNIVSSELYELQGPEPNIVSAKSGFSYNPQGLVSKIERRDKANKVLTVTNYTYYPDLNVKEMQEFKPKDNQLWLSGKTAYSVTNDFSKLGGDGLRTIMGPEYVAALFSESIQEYRYAENGTLTTHSSRLMSAREFNDDGTLKRQLQTVKPIKPLGVEKVSLAEYKYTLH